MTLSAPLRFTNLFPALSARSSRPGPGFMQLIQRAMQVSIAGTLALCALTWMALAPGLRVRRKAGRGGV